ncbi:hypothetical protein [Lapidilactobacillus luobeiensis]|nr:hypothetical protein [Lapidilactobacillus luobeiensis]
MKAIKLDLDNLVMNLQHFAENSGTADTDNVDGGSQDGNADMMV